MANEKSSFWQDFRKFISRGNVIDMAVGVVIGGAFGKIVTGLVNYIINPFVGLFAKSGDLDSLKTVIHPAVEAVLDEAGNVVTAASAEVAILWGTWLQTVVDFLITAFCIFVALRAIVKAKDILEADAKEAEKKKADEEKVKADEAKRVADAAAAAAAEKQEALESSVMKQEKLLEEICQLLRNKS